MQQIYEAQLAEALERRDEKGFDVAGFRLLLSVSRARGAFELKGEDGVVWVWSDLHLGDVEALTFFGRPFRSVDEMDNVLCERWRSSVGPDDVVVCLGDVGTWPSSAKGSDIDASTVTVNDCAALKPPGSVAVTRIVAAPSATAVSLTRTPVTPAVTTCGADDDTEYVNASSSGSTNAPETSTLTVSSGTKVRFSNIAAGTGDRFCTWVKFATIENWSAATLGFPASSSAAPAAMSTVTVPRGCRRDRRAVARAGPPEGRRAAVPDDQVGEIEAGNRLRERDRDRERPCDRGTRVSADHHRRRHGVRAHAVQHRPAAREQRLERIPLGRVDAQPVLQLDRDDPLREPTTVSLRHPLCGVSGTLRSVHGRVRDREVFQISRDVPAPIISDLGVVRLRQRDDVLDVRRSGSVGRDVERKARVRRIRPDRRPSSSPAGPR